MSEDERHRRSMRLQGSDYTQSGAFLVTIVPQDRQYLFWAIVKGHMRSAEGRVRVGWSGEARGANRE
jgi:hypothetical protein